MLNSLDIKKTLDIIESTLISVRERQLQEELSDKKLSFEELEKIFDTNLEGTQSLDAVKSFFSDYLQYSVNTAHPYFNNQLFSGVEWSAVLGDFLTSITNTTMATFESSPVGTVLESKLIEKLLAKIGYDGGEGIMVGGGSQANMQAMVCARQHMFPDFNADPAACKPLTMFVSEHAHYSFKKAAMVMGLGKAGVVKVPVNAKNQMDPKELDRLIQKTIDDNRQPFLVAATAGTTVYGAFDSVPGLAKVCKSRNLWLHVDGAWGAPAFFSDRYKDLLAGSALADSWTWDAHKLMGASLTSSFFLSKHKGTLFNANNIDEGKYIFHEDAAVSCDFGPMSLQCGRRVTSASLWTQWLKEGDEGFKKKVESLDDLKLYIVGQIKKNPRLELITEAPFLNVCFRVRSDKASCENHFNRQIRETLKNRGQFLVNFYEDTNGLLFFRFILANSLFEQKHVDAFLNYLLTVADELEAGVQDGAHAKGSLLNSVV